MVKDNPPFYSKLDTTWQKAGAPNKNEFIDWNNDLCGLYCLKMVGDYFNVTKNTSLWEILIKCRELNGFKDINGERVGVFHKSLLKTAKSFGLKGKTERNFNLKKIIKNLSKNHLVILSVDKNKINSKLTGGHLILVYDYLVDKDICILHDPDQILSKSGENVEINLGELAKISNNKGLVIKSLSASKLK